MLSLLPVLSSRALCASVCAELIGTRSVSDGRELPLWVLRELPVWLVRNRMPTNRMLLNEAWLTPGCFPAAADSSVVSSLAGGTGLAADGLMILDGILRHRNLRLPLRPRRPEYACNSIQFVGQTGNVQLLISTHWSRITNS